MLLVNRIIALPIMTDGRQGLVIRLDDKPPLFSAINNAQVPQSVEGAGHR